MKIPQAVWNIGNAVLSAAISGASGAVCQMALDPSHIDWKHTGSVALMGAVIGVANHYRTPPTVMAQEAMVLKATPAGQIAEAQNVVIGAVAATVKADAEAVTEKTKE